MVERLPSDNQKLVVINCSKTAEEVQKHQVYICPADGAAYQHQESRYFGLYKKLTISHLANIEAVVRVNTDNSTEFYWVAGGDSEENYRQKAIAFANELRFSKEHPPIPVKVFILGLLQRTDFKKDTVGGMQGSKHYFDTSKYNVSTAGFLAMKLTGKTWTAF